ncbi:DUF551 domain-containing protein [Ideonella sp.]|uniref:DUF551 domain-containing protein n=1 Tax=Ideonella sp. TaxID=1929293 RepID=UPI002B471EFA|nr:DUF551 domain-containing protein [Ideonella sp.]HJV69497.1 DUF551 domain-containing protein [Ideonella sp.]
MNNWITVAEQLPPKDTLVLVRGWHPDQPRAERVVTAARLLDSWATEDAEGNYSEVWADDVEFDELTFSPTQWQPMPARA